MAADFDRYAIYWVPERSDGLSRFGCAWTGWCPDQGEHSARETLAGFPFDVPALTASSWRHGCHGVIKAPFRATGSGERWLVERELEELSEAIATFTLPRFEIAVVDHRVTLVPCCHLADLAQMLARVEAVLAPVTDTADPVRLRRSVAAAAGAGARVVQHPAARSRFHVPLTDRLDIDLAHAVAEALAPVLEPYLERRRRLRDLALMGDPGDGRPLRVLQRYELRRTPLRPGSAALPVHGPQVLAPGLNDRAVETDVAI